MKYTGWSLYERVKKVVERSFYMIYLHTEQTYCWVDDIHLVYGALSSEDDTPVVFVEIGYLYLGKNYHLNVIFDLDESDEFNVGYINSCIENYDDKE